MAIILSIIAICLSAFTFWWTSLRNPKIFKLINVKERTGEGMIPEFALVNGSKKDLLITSLVCIFVDPQGKGSRLIPAQRLDFKESDSFILKSESAFHCKITFLSPFTKAFATQGKLENDLYKYDMYIDIAWVEMNGKTYKKSIKFITYGFREDGEIGLYFPVLKSAELYDKTHLKALSPFRIH